MNMRSNGGIYEQHFQNLVSTLRGTYTYIEPRSLNNDMLGIVIIIFSCLLSLFLRMPAENGSKIGKKKSVLTPNKCLRCGAS